MKNCSPEIKYLLNPRSIAIIGASHNKDKIGYKILQNIVSGGYKGKIYPINPKGGEILDLKVYPTIEDVPGEVDVATITVPAKFVFDSVKSCANKKVKFAPIISSGFSEIGNIEEEKQIVKYAREHNMRILGPNIFGVYSAESSLNATFGPDTILPGSVAIITQSGALGLAMIGKTAVENIGLSTIISVGNKADIEEYELLSYLADHDDTKIIMMYIEGVHEGLKLINVLKNITREKPIIVIKSGRSQRGAMAVASHTGSLAGSDKIFDSIMKQCGVIRAENIREAFDWCKFFASAPRSLDNQSVIITNGGGIGVLAADACEKFNVSLYDNPSKLKEIFGPVTPDFGSTKNPIDLTGQATSEYYDKALQAAIHNNDIGGVIGLYCETAVFDVDNLAKMIEKSHHMFQAAGKPLVFSIFGGENIEKAILSLRQKSIPVFDDVYEAVSCLGRLSSHTQYINHYSSSYVEADIDIDAIEHITKKALKEGRQFLLAHECHAVMQLAGITVPKSYIAKDMAEAVKYAKIVGYPVVMKVVSPDILHKSDAGGVALDLENDREVVDAYQAIMQSCKSYYPNAVITGVEITEMVHSGVEIIVGARKDNSFGPIVMCGLGGIYVEVMKDISFRSAYLSYPEIVNMIQEIRSYPILLGVRGEDKKDINGLTNTIITIGTIIRKCDTISDIEINPVLVYDQGQGVKAIDVRILLSHTKENQ